MTFEELQSKIEVVKVISKQWDDLLKGLVAQRNEACPHTELVADSYYFSGSYYDQSYTDYWDRCKVCGKVFNERTKGNGYYG